MQVVLWIVLSFLAAIGLMDLLREIQHRILQTDHIQSITVLPMKGFVNDAEYHLRALLCDNWNHPFSTQLAIVDLGMDNETLQICQTLADEYQTLRIYSRDEFEKLFY